MSHQVTIDFEGISIKIKSQCEVAAHSLCKIDKKLDLIHRSADKLETSKVKEYEEYLNRSKEQIQRKLNILTTSLEEYKSLKTQKFDADMRYGDARSKELAHIYQELTGVIKNEAEDLANLVDDLTGAKLEVIDQMINEGLLDASSESAQKLLNKINGVVDISKDKLDKLNTIQDISLRELAYRELIKEENENVDFDSILSKAQSNYDALLGKKTKEVIETYKEELKSNGVSSEVLDNVKSIEEANKVVNAAITDEKIRVETLKVIIKAIKDRGFIVDTKKNLKIDRNKNVVKLVALKASGQKAEFEIQLNGKFMYHFDGYEGLACNKDITPFMDDLQNIYDIKILHEEVIWSNPDKIQTQKYQYVNKNKGTN